MAGLGKTKSNNGMEIDTSIANGNVINTQVTSNSEDDKVTLGHHVGIFGGIGLVLGTMIGSGIFITPTGVAEAADSEALSLVIWGFGGIISLFGSLSLAELAFVIQKSGGEYMYVRETYSEWLSFMFAWTDGLVSRPPGQAISALTCATYILVPLFSDGCGSPPKHLVSMLGVAILLTIAAINSYSIRLSNAVNVVFSAGKIIALVVIVIGGIVQLANGKTQYLATGFEGSTKSPGQIFMAFYSVMFTYSGWSSLSYVTLEISKPKRNIPLVSFISIPLVTLLYLMVNVSYFTVMSTDQLVASDAVAVTWAQSVLPQVPWLIPLCVAVSTLGVANTASFSLQRLFYGMGKNGEMPEVLSYLHQNRNTPVPAISLECILAIPYVILGNVPSLIDSLSFVGWIFNTLIQIAVIVLRFKMKDASRPYKVPIIFPIIVAMFGVCLVIVPIVDTPQIEFLYATLLVLASMVIYIPLAIYGRPVKFMKYVTSFLQLLMDVVPPHEEELKYE